MHAMHAALRGAYRMAASHPSFAGRRAVRDSRLRAMVDEDRIVAGNGCAGIGIGRCTGARIAARACRTDTVQQPHR